jgi:hypothetical protein
MSESCAVPKVDKRNSFWKEVPMIAQPHADLNLYVYPFRNSPWVILQVDGDDLIPFMGYTLSADYCFWVWTVCSTKYVPIKAVSKKQSKLSIHYSR